MKRKSGFTIVELMVVVVIIGILTALAMPQYIKTVERSRQSEALTSLSAIRGAQMRYYLENSNYTTNFSDLDIDNMTNGTYFDYILVNNQSYSGVDNVIGYGVRNTVKRPGSYGSYNITIKASGMVNKTGCSGGC